MLFSIYSSFNFISCYAFWFCMSKSYAGSFVLHYFSLRISSESCYISLFSDIINSNKAIFLADLMIIYLFLSLYTFGSATVYVCGYHVLLRK